jgi:secreted PhoX family phosphatase
MDHVDDDTVSNTSDNPTLDEIAAARLTRRSVLGGGVAAAAVVSASGIGALLSSVPASAKGGRKHLLGFTGIAPTTADAVTVPPGYTAKVLIAWGDPVSDGPAFRQDASNSAYEQEWQWGMHNDGLVYFPIRGSARGLIVQNHEYTDDGLLFPDGTANWDAEKTRKSLAAHGVGIIEVTKQRGGRWRVVRPSPYARRITGETPIEIRGPARGDARLRTSADPSGTVVLGTLNNCAMGFTPWGTYLACEENFNGYFRKAPGVAQTELERRYGISSGGFGYLWHLTEARFRVDAGVLPGQPDAPYEPNEPNRFGWVVEIDPYDPGSTPVKRTALGRMKHEGAWVQEARDGRVVVYMGDDEQFEYIYRYVSRMPWRRARAQGINPLDDGTLYVAKFNDDGTGVWLPLTPRNSSLAGWSLNDILINTRGAADAAGGTPMDRPEWIDTFPDDLAGIVTLTNNSARGVIGTNPRTLQPNPGVDAANPRVRSAYGHIVKWTYRRDFTEPVFRWEIFALAGDPDPASPVPDDGSTIVGDKYGSPDGLYVAPSGRLWIQTDVSASTINVNAYTGFGNNQMLCADPVTRETRRFLVGPAGCEVTGVFVTPDESTMFVGIQHPGEAPSGNLDPANPKQYSSWPDGPQGGRPRSALVVITKDDGGPIGS